MGDASDILEQAKDHYKTAKDAWQQIYRKARDDLRFLSDEPFAQWDEKEANARLTVGRPVIEVDQLSQFIHQVDNDIRMNTPSIKVMPDGDGADQKTAEMVQGRIRAIEYKSNADAAYDMAASFSIKSSIGYIRIDHDYVNDRSFDQELKIKRVINPCAILLDPNSIEPDGSDAKYGFVFEEISVKEFNKLYEGKTPVSFGDEEKPTRAQQDTDKITIAEYFYIEESYEEKGLLENGTIENVVKGKKYKSQRRITKPKVYRCKLSGEDELERTTFPGKYIPLVPVYGEEAWADGKRNLNSLIRKSKSSQMAYNMLKSSETEILLKQQQAPVQAAVGQMRGFEEDWKRPEKAMVLYYHQTDANGESAPPPQRLQPPVVSTGFANASMDAENNIRKTLGMYNAGVGKREGESSGVALKQLERSGDIASFHFGDNLVRSITHVGKILVCALPEIEDTPRIVNIIGQEDDHKLIGINGAMIEGQDQTYDFTKGSWDVRVITGPSFTTQRQEAAQYYADVIKSAPDLMPVIGDLVFKYQDAPGAMAISSRLKKLVDPKLLEEQERGKESDPAMEQMQQQMQQVVQEAQAKIAELQGELENKQSDLLVKEAEIQIKTKELEIKAAEVGIRAQEIQKEIPMDVHAQSIKEREMRLKEAEFELKFLQETEKQKERQTEDTEMAMQDSVEVLEQKIALLQQNLLMKQQEAELQQKRQAEEEAEKEERRKQAAALMQGLLGIQQMIGQLVESTRAPISIVRDEAGNMIGAR